MTIRRGAGTLWLTQLNESLQERLQSTDVSYIVTLTQAEYDALTPDAKTLYIITD